MLSSGRVEGAGRAAAVPPSRTAFGKLLRRYRLAASLTQEELAEQAGVSLRGLSDLERGARQVPHPGTLRRLEDALHLAESDRAVLRVAAGRLEPSSVAEPVSASPRRLLPEPLTSFVGREHDLTEVRRLLAGARLLTLTGPGGVGKTRLALEIARAEMNTFADGVLLIELAATIDAELVPQAVASALGIGGQPRRPLAEVLAEAIATRHMLLVLDNCEHLTAACADLAHQLLRAAPRLKILATSREVLAVGGEVVWAVPPLSLPEAGRATPNQIAQAEAIQLFVERASGVAPGFSLTELNASHVAEICRRLDGVPLSIELAAARVRLLGVEQIAARLDDRFRLLSSGSRSAPPRHQSLRAALDWSFELLGQPERQLFERLAVFAGGWTLEAVEAVCPGEGLEPGAVLDSLAQLLDKSLVAGEEHTDGMRYRFLETVRQYAQERLDASGQADAVHSRHAKYFAALGRRAEPHLRGGPQFATWMARLEPERDNVRAALRWCMGAEELERGLELGSTLWRYWYVQGALAEGREWLEALLRLVGEGRRTAAHSDALCGAGALASQEGDFAAARELFGEGLAIARELGDQRRIGICLNALGVNANHRRDGVAARALLEEALVEERACGDRIMEATSLTNLADVVVEQGEYVASRLLLEKSAAILHELGDWTSAANTRGKIGFVALSQGDLATARAHCETALQMLREAGDARGVASRCLELGWVRHLQGDEEAAHALLTEGFLTSQSLGNRWLMARCLEGLAGLAAARAQPERALRLAGAAAKLQELIGPAQPGLVGASARSLIDRAQMAWLEPTRAALGRVVSAALWSEGQAMSLDQLVSPTAVQAGLQAKPTSVSD